MGQAVLVSATCKKSNQVKKISCFHKCGFYEFLLKKKPSILTSRSDLRGHKASTSSKNITQGAEFLAR